MSEVSDVPDEDWSLWRDFVVMRRELDRAIEQRLQSDAGISNADFDILLSLSKSAEGRLRARDLGELLGWEKSRISHQVTRMVARGLLERQECGTDLRGTWVVLLPEGRRAVLKALRGNARELRRLFFDLLSPEEKQAVGQLSRKVIDAVDSSACTRADEIFAGEGAARAAS